MVPAERWNTAAILLRIGFWGYIVYCEHSKGPFESSVVNANLFKLLNPKP